MNKKVIYLTEKELIAELAKVKTVKGMPIFASILQLTEPKCTVKSRVNKDIKNPYAKVQKLSKVSVIFNSDYEKAVVNQLHKEGEEASAYIKGENTMPLTFGENNQIIGLNEKNGQYALQYRPNDNVKPVTKYFADGKMIDKAKLVDFLPKESHATNQGTEREILWRKLYVSNVLQLAFNGKVYRLIR